MKGKIYSVTVTFNPSLQDHKLEKQLRFLLKNGIVPFVIDNNSKNFEEVNEMLLSLSTHITVTKLDKNYGIGKALNIGITECLKREECEWIMTLDQDTYFDDDAYLPIIKAVEEYSPTNIGLLGLNYTKKRFTKTCLANDSGYPEPTDFVITSGSLAKREVYELIKYDERLFMYFLDNDLCIRMLNAGYGIMILAKPCIMHSEGERVLKDKDEYFVLDPWKLFFVGRNSIIMYIRYFTIRPIFYLVFVLLENIFARYNIRNSIFFAVKGILAGLFKNI